MRIFEDFIDSTDAQDVIGNDSVQVSDVPEGALDTEHHDFYMTVSVPEGDIITSTYMRNEVIAAFKRTQVMINSILNHTHEITSHSYPQFVTTVSWLPDYMKDIMGPDMLGMAGSHIVFTFDGNFRRPYNVLRFISQLFIAAIGKKLAAQDRGCEMSVYQTEHKPKTELRTCPHCNFIGTQYIYKLVVNNEFNGDADEIYTRFAQVLSPAAYFIPKIETYEFVANMTGTDNSSIVMDQLIRKLNGQSQKKAKVVPLSAAFKNRMESHWITSDNIKNLIKSASPMRYIVAYNSMRPTNKNSLKIFSLDEKDSSNRRDIINAIDERPLRCADWKMMTSEFGRNIFFVAYCGVAIVDNNICDILVAIYNNEIVYGHDLNEDILRNGFFKDLNRLLGSELTDKDYQTILKGVEKNAVNL